MGGLDAFRKVAASRCVDDCYVTMSARLEAFFLDTGVDQWDREHYTVRIIHTSIHPQLILLLLLTMYVEDGISTHVNSQYGSDKPLSNALTQLAPKENGMGPCVTSQENHLMIGVNATCLYADLSIYYTILDPTWLSSEQAGEDLCKL